MKNKLLAIWFNFIRPLVFAYDGFVDGWKSLEDDYEDFKCMYCEKPVLRRYLYCSVECSRRDDYENIPF